MTTEPTAPVELWLGLSSTAWSGVAALATVSAVLVAIGGAVLVLRQISQARDLAEDQARPYLVAVMEESEADRQIIDFVIRNIGQTAAREVTLALDPPYVRSDELPEPHHFMGARFITGSTGVIPPGGELRTFMDTTRDLVQAKNAGKGNVAQPLSLTLTYSDRLGRKIVEEFKLDIWERSGTVRTEVYGLHHIAKSLRAWTKKQGVNNY